MNKIEQLHLDCMIVKDLQAASKSAEITEQIAIEFAEFVTTYPDKNKNIHGEMLHAKSKYDGAETTKELFREFLKTKEDGTD